QYRFDEPWDGPHNKLLIEQMPAVYSASGQDGTPASRSKASYFVFAGPAAALGSPSIPGGKNSGATLAQMTAGLSNTILGVEAKRDIPWTNPDDIPFDSDGQIPPLGGFWPDGFNMLMGDGSVRFVKSQVDPIILKALITRAGGEAISFQALDPGPRR